MGDGAGLAFFWSGHSRWCPTWPHMSSRAYMKNGIWGHGSGRRAGGPGDGRDGSQGGQTWADTGEGEGAAKEAIVQTGNKITRRRPGKTFSRAGTPPSSFSPILLILFVPSLPLGPPSFLPHLARMCCLSLSEWTKGMRPLEEAPIASGDGGDKTRSASHGAVPSEFHSTQQKHERALGFAGEDGWAPALAAAASCLSPLPSLPRRREEQTEGLGAEVPNPSRHQEPVLL